MTTPEPMPEPIRERTRPPEDTVRDDFRDDVVPEEALLPADEAPLPEQTMPPVEEMPLEPASRAETVLPPEPAPATTVPGPVGGTAGEDSWMQLQGRFVDDPAGAVRGAAQLVEDAIAHLHQSLDHLADGNSTEDLRRAFQRYRLVHQTLIEV
jgi:hypothetical protein